MEPRALFETFIKRHQNSPLKSWLPQLEAMIQAKFYDKPHGDLARWTEALASLPDLEPSQVELNQAVMSCSQDQALDQATRQALDTSLRQLMPWRKGPYQVFDTLIDTEWRSDMKWDRIAHQLAPLKNRTVLDVGCGSGYHMWRMLGAGATEVIGIDPSYLFLFQFNTIKKYFGPDLPIDLLPFKLEDISGECKAFDTVFSMGVLYHRKSPIDHLYELKQLLRPKGELVLETLVVEGPNGYSLVPEDRYAMMRNVWFIPSIYTLSHWMQRSGFKNIRCVSDCITTTEEQRVTDWMTFQSLSDFLDPHDSSLTIEGYPAPRRAVFVAEI